MKKQESLLLIILLLLLVFLTAWDLFNDRDKGLGLIHLAAEGGAFLVSLGSAGHLLFQLFLSHEKNSQLTRDLNRTQMELSAFREEAQVHIKGLSSLMDKQLDQWKLTKSEKEIALLLIKGLSFKEMAEARKSSERTVRQHSIEIYRKSGLSGRAELAAFFIEDLFDP